MFIENPKNFIYYLMQYYSNKTSKQKLKSFYWSIIYENSSGYISIGDPPHIYNPIFIILKITKINFFLNLILRRDIRQ